MHRTEADGSSGGLYVDEALPLVEGTVVNAADRNAVQEELCAVIERAGLTVQTAATDTRDQLEAVVFDTHITRKAALSIANDTDASTLTIRSGQSTVENPVEYQSAYTGSVSGVFAAGSVGSRSADSADTVVITKDGVSYRNNISATHGGSKFATFDLSALSPTLSSSGRVYETTGGIGITLAGVPWNCRVYGATLSYRSTGATGLPRSCPVWFESSATTGDQYVARLIFLSPENPWAGTFTDQALTLHFNALAGEW